MSTFGNWRNTLRDRAASKLPGVNCYITANPTSFFKANAWHGPAVVFEFLRMPPVDTTSRLIGTGEQLMDLYFNVYVASRGGDISTQDDVIPNNDLGTIEQNEQMTNGIFDTLDRLVPALEYFEVDTNCRCLFQGWEQWAEAPMTAIYITRWRVGGYVVSGDGS